MQTEMKNHSFYEQRGVGAAGGGDGGGGYEATCHDFTPPTKCLAKKKKSVWSGATSKGGENS